MKILCIGDSNTYGYDPGSYCGGRYSARIRWTDRLKGHHVINCGMNGLSVPSDSRDFIDLIRSTAPDLVTVMLGVNDLLQGAGADSTALRMEAFLTGIRNAQLNTRILLMAPPPLRPGEWVRDKRVIGESEKLTKKYRELAHRTGVCFADAGAWKVGLTSDGVHFSEDGHAAFACGLEAILTEQLSPDDNSSSLL